MCHFRGTEWRDLWSCFSWSRGRAVCSSTTFHKENPNILSPIFVCFISKIKVLTTENPQVPTLCPQRTGHLPPWKPSGACQLQGDPYSSGLELGKGGGGEKRQAFPLKLNTSGHQITWPFTVISVKIISCLVAPALLAHLYCLQQATARPVSGGWLHGYPFLHSLVKWNASGLWVPGSRLLSNHNPAINQANLREINLINISIVAD